ncbi:MAG TPA: hypothetical protein VMS17_16230 [Gemmataceae bacterium]|nr:hypothetical protein [Gemmataceae bacterium]
MSASPERSETDRFGVWQRNALIVGGALVAVAVVIGLFRPASFFRAYLIAFQFCLGVSLGCMVVMMIRHLTGGAWGMRLRPILEAGAALIPVTAVMFLPLLVGLAFLYPWYPSDGSRAAALPPHQMQWFNLPFFIVRAVIYFGIWTGFTVLLNRGPRRPNVPPFEEPPRIFRAVSAIGIAVYGLTITAASIDWSLSLDLPWFSTIYGAMYAGGQLLAGFGFAVLVMVVLSKGLPSQLLRDFGNLLLAFTMIWAYLSFSQYLLIWAGNLPEETAYFRPRFDNGWQWFILLILLAEFAAPFLLLLLKRTKVSPVLLGGVAGVSLVAHYLYLVWLTVPNLPDDSWDLLFFSPALLVGLGGIWLGLFLWRLQRRPFATGAGSEPTETEEPNATRSALVQSFRGPHP